MNQQFMKEKKIVPLVLQMSVPMILSMAVHIPLEQRAESDRTARCSGLNGTKIFQS